MRRSLLVLGAAMVFVASFGAAASSAGDTAAAAPKPLAILYSVATPDLRIANNGQRHTISIPASTRITWFTDRPARRAGHTDARSFALAWHANGFDTDPPNAALLLERGKNTTTHVVTLRKPVLAGGRLTFTVTLIRDGEEAGHATTHPLRAGRARGSLFIDDAAYPECNDVLESSSDCISGWNGQAWVRVQSPTLHPQPTVCSVGGKEAAFNEIWAYTSDGREVWYKDTRWFNIPGCPAMMNVTHEYNDLELILALKKAGTGGYLVVRIAAGSALVDFP